MCPKPTTHTTFQVSCSYMVMACYTDAATCAAAAAAGYVQGSFLGGGIEDCRIIIENERY